ncbi:hypothetical protein [Chondromyces apiculatus]|uniref:hypothetical protein n=1 Tax=Chondromyces apiculatus TaxID=51 RepID=UPI0012DCEAF9|nr:hypothetical protein [Chondromyces apiculatus]
MTECVRRRMVSDLEAFLLPLQAASPPRFSAWMTSQADWDRFTKALASLKEALEGVNLAEGARRDGSSSGGAAFTLCERSALTERIFLARTLASGDLTWFVARVESVQGHGQQTRDVVTGVRRHAEKPPKPAAVEDGQRRLAPSAWQELAAGAKAVEDGAPALAEATCALWPQAVEALGGSAACRDKRTHYYFAHCNLRESPPGPTVTKVGSATERTPGDLQVSVSLVQ